MSARLLLPLLVAIFVLAVLGQAFVIPSTTTSHSCSTQQQQSSPFHQLPRDSATSSVSLFAKKKRRRRKKSGDQSAVPPEQPEIVEAAPDPFVEESAAAAPNELPDFDLDDGEKEIAAKEILRATTNPDVITPNMMSSGYRGPTSSLDELVNDRSLESKFEFEDQGDPSIPDFVDLARSSSTEPTYNPDGLSTAGIGKKKQRQAERVARAIAAKEAEGSGENTLANYFPAFTDEKGKFSTVKVLENGAKFGIGALILWEIYINSPFFDRVAPMAPIVFEIVM